MPMFVVPYENSGSITTIKKADITRRISAFLLVSHMAIPKIKDATRNSDLAKNNKTIKPDV